MNPDNEDAQEILRAQRVKDFMQRLGVPNHTTIRSQSGHVAKIIDVNDERLTIEIVQGVKGDNQMQPGTKTTIPLNKFLPKFLGEQGQG
jgi:hypothetical protein